MTIIKTHGKIRAFLIFGFFLLGLMLFTQTIEAATLTVTSNGDQTINAAGCADGCTLREAIAAASSGDTIIFDATLAGKTILLRGTQLTVDKSLTIINSNLPLVAISGNNQSRVFRITTGTVELNGLIIKDGRVSNSAGGGGIRSNSGSNLTINNCLVIANSVIPSTSFALGGGIYGGDAVTITNSTISGNIAHSSDNESRGGGIYGVDTVTVTNSTISGNTSISTFQFSRASGGGIYGEVLITNSTISGNSANSATTISNFNFGWGGGIYGGGTITNSTIRGNSVTAFSGAGIAIGGGIFVDSSSSITITNSTISENTVTFSSDPGSGFGGGIYNFESTATIINSTITNNTAETSGDGIFQRGNLSLKNTIVAQNGSEDIFRHSGTLTSNGNNLIGNNTTVTTQFPAGSPNANGDYVGTSGTPIDAMLDPLTNNFGDTATHALLAGSLAINNGNNTGAPTTDQRGFSRPQGGTVDIGAYEFSGVTITTPALSDGLTGIGYNENVGASGGTLPYTFSFTGTPPPGLMINSTTGKITGTPTTAGTYNFGVQVQDSTALAEERNKSRKNSKSNLAPNVAVQNYQVMIMAPTAAAVSLRGRVINSNGRTLKSALVVLIGTTGETKVYRTNQFGYFNFKELKAGEIYIIEAYRKGYEFEPRIVRLEDTITNFEMASLP